MTNNPPGDFIKKPMSILFPHIYKESTTSRTRMLCQLLSQEDENWVEEYCRDYLHVFAPRDVIVWYGVARAMFQGKCIKLQKVTLSDLKKRWCVQPKHLLTIIDSNRYSTYQDTDANLPKGKPHVFVLPGEKYTITSLMLDYDDDEVIGYEFVARDPPEKVVGRSDWRC